MAGKLQILGEFADFTSAHGLSALHRNKSGVVKLIWVVFIFIAWFALGYQVYMTLDQYYTYPTTTSIRMKHARHPQFPAVTICNLNPIKRDAFRELDKLREILNKTGEPQTWDELGNGTGEKSVSEHDLLEQLFYYEIQNKSVDMAKHGHLLKEMLAECVFKGRICVPSDFVQWTHGRFGNCYTFMNNDSLERVTSSGPNHGLDISLLIQEGEYVNRLNPTAGFVVELHHPLYAPFPEDKGFVISPGMSTSAAIRMRKISRLGLPYDGVDCGQNTTEAISGFIANWAETRLRKGFVIPANYSNTACLQECRLRFVLVECGCLLASMLDKRYIKNFRIPSNREKFLICSPNGSMPGNLTCAAQATMKLNMNGICESQCLQACNQILYPALLTTNVWPRGQYVNEMADTWEKRLGKTLPNSTVARNALTRLQVYFEDLNYEHVSEEKVYSLWSLFSSIGGTLGLFGGVSFLTMVEIFELIWRLSSGRSVKEEERVDKNRPTVRSFDTK